jgi:hypothetical protein
MKLRAEGYYPSRRFRNMDGFSLYPYRLSFATGQTRSVFAKEGFQAYRLANGTGGVRLEAPELTE